MTFAVCGDGWYMQGSVDGRLLQRVVLDIVSRHHAACILSTILLSGTLPMLTNASNICFLPPNDHTNE